MKTCFYILGVCLILFFDSCYLLEPGSDRDGSAYDAWTPIKSDSMVVYKDRNEIYAILSKNVKYDTIYRIDPTKYKYYGEVSGDVRFSKYKIFYARLEFDILNIKGTKAIKVYLREHIISKRPKRCANAIDSYIRKLLLN